MKVQQLGTANPKVKECVIDLMPVDWFGDREEYEKSDIRIITVGLNPSDREFEEQLYDKSVPLEKRKLSLFRFSAYNPQEPNTHRVALNNYYKTKNVYTQWFNSYEHVLNGMGASYFSNKGIKIRAIHTDICSPWATCPTWSKLPKDVKNELFAEGKAQWEHLVKELKPDVIIASIGKDYIKALGIESTHKKLCEFKTKKDGKPRKRPLVIGIYKYNGIPLIAGGAGMVPFALLSNNQKEELGKNIRKKVLK